jgi:hypothetical protein
MVEGWPEGASVSDEGDHAKRGGGGAARSEAIEAPRVLAHEAAR